MEEEPVATVEEVDQPVAEAEPEEVQAAPPVEEAAAEVAPVAVVESEPAATEEAVIKSGDVEESKETSEQVPDAAAEPVAVTVTESAEPAAEPTSEPTTVVVDEAGQEATATEPSATESIAAEPAIEEPAVAEAPVVTEAPKAKPVDPPYEPPAPIRPSSVAPSQPISVPSSMPTISNNLSNSASAMGLSNFAMKSLDPKSSTFVPSLADETDFQNAKAYLLQTSTISGLNVYDHLTAVVMRVLEQRPPNVVDIFESISADVKRTRFQYEASGISANVNSKEPLEQGIINSAEKLMKLFETPQEFDEKGNPVPPPEVNDGEIPDILELANLFEHAGVSLGREETFRLLLSIKRLVETRPLKSVRLFGKILGTKANYYVVESEVREGEELPEGDLVPAQTLPASEKARNNGSGENLDDKADASAAKDEKQAPLISDGAPRPKVKKYAPLPAEVGSGVNKYTYWVVNEASGVWKRLPDASPEAIQASRNIRKFFTGDLYKTIESYPPFPGNEALYLRCQIARIASATVISPSGYYAFENEDGEENEGENGGDSSSIIVNPEYEGLSNDALLEPSNWVHHVPFILPQGRTVYTKPELIRDEEENRRRDDDDADEDDEDREEEDEDNGEDEAEPEAGPALLTAIAEDEEINTLPAWSPRLALPLAPTKYSPVFLRSNKWPGAVAVGYNDKFANIYIGYGHEQVQGPSQQFVPPPLPEIQKEYEGEPIKEMDDPTLEQERAAEEARRENEEEKAESDQGEREGESDEEDD